MTPRESHYHVPVRAGGVPLSDAKSALICVHGRGASADDALSLGLMVAPPNTAVLAPQASGRSWYPQSFLAPKAANQPDLDAALNVLEHLIGSLREAGIPRDQTLLCGFSQGACLTAEFVARNPESCTAAAILTGGLIGDMINDRPYGRFSSPCHLFLTTGDPDAHVPPSRTIASAEMLEVLGARTTIRIYAGRPHTVSQDELQFVHDLFHKSVST